LLTSPPAPAMAVENSAQPPGGANKEAKARRPEAGARP